MLLVERNAQRILSALRWWGRWAWDGGWSAEVDGWARVQGFRIKSSKESLILLDSLHCSRYELRMLWEDLASRDSLSRDLTIAVR